MLFGVRCWVMGVGCWVFGGGFATAQRYVVVDDKIPVAVSDVEKITYAVDDQFETTLLPGRLAADAKTRLFSQALQETGLADTLRLYWIDYKCPYSGKYYYKPHVWSEVAWYNTQRFRMFTVFAETDDVLAAQGINSLSDLKAYAKRVYDAVYPEDAGVSDPKDRRNSLNRFVAYHILRHGSTYYYLTAYDNYKLMYCFDRNLADIAAWYATLMPGAAMKCSYPDAGDESGLYLNRRGLKDGPDKYGKQIRGAKIVADGDGSEDPFTHKAFNGYYYYIDRMLTYDQQTRDDVLGGERWRVDAKTLSPDIMNVYDRFGFYEHYTDDIDPNAPAVKNHIFAWDGIENFSNATDNPGLVLRRPHLYIDSYECDEMNVFGDFDITIKLPPLPAGEWEVRLGNDAAVSRTNVRVWLNGTLAIDSLSLCDEYQENSTLPYKTMKGPKEFGHYGGRPGEFYAFYNYSSFVRIVLGRLQSDGKNDNYLRFKMLDNGEQGSNEFMIDYLEFCPASVCDNQDIPED